MKCSNCGFENEQGSFCGNCGCPLNSEPVPLTEAENNRLFTRQKILDLANDNLFMVICVCLSVSVGLSLLFDGLDIVDILVMIFCWIIYDKARKGTADARGVQNISGVVYFIYILRYVAAGLAFLGSCLSAFALNSVNFKEAVSKADLEMYNLEHFYDLLEWLWAIPWIIVVLGIIFAVITIIFNIFGWQRIHAFVQSVYKSAVNGAPDYRCAKSAKNWLLFFGISDLAVTGVFGFLTLDIFSILISTLPAALHILGALLIDKHFLKVEN